MTDRDDSRPAASEPPRSDGPALSERMRVDGFIKALGLWDVIAMNIVAVVGLRWIARSARAGAPSVTLWILAWAVFFIPLACALIELSSRHPEQGGMYAWVRRAYGRLHGFICGWCMWVNNLFYFPALLLFAGANFALVLGPRGEGLAENRLYSVVFVLGFLWFATALNIIGLAAGKWLQHLGNIATWIPVLLLVICGAIAFASFGSATSFAPSELVPRDEVLSTLSLWSSMCFAFSGFEIVTMMGQEVRNPRRTIPVGIIVAGVAVTVIYMLGSTSGTGGGARQRAGRAEWRRRCHRRRHQPSGPCGDGSADRSVAGGRRRWRYELVGRGRGASAVRGRRRRRAAEGVRASASTVSHAGRRAHRAGRRCQRCSSSPASSSRSAAARRRCRRPTTSW